MKKHVLVVEDEHDMADMICRFLRKEGYKTSHLDSGEQAIDFILNRKPNLVVLDLMLPGKDGLEICQAVRRYSDVPIIMVTAKVSEAERLIGFDAGADDYVCKPFSALELVMRVNVNLRRAGGQAQLDDTLLLNTDTLIVSFQDKSISLTALECELLKLLKAKPGTIYSRNYILDNIYQDFRIVSDRTADSHIRNLRKKLKHLSTEHEFIESVYGAGYRFVSKE